MESYERHEMSFGYDALTMETGLGVLVDSMREHGFDKETPIVLFEGAILDGWNRYQAAQIAGVEPEFIEFEGDETDAVYFVIRHNSARRHMTIIQQAYAMRRIEVLLPQNKQRTPAQVAALTGASLAQVKKGFLMFDEDPELAEKVAEGEVDAKKAERDRGYTPPDTTKGLACTNGNVIKKFHGALAGVPGIRSSMTEKTAINEALSLWASAREKGHRLVAVPADVTDEMIETLV